MGGIWEGLLGGLEEVLRFFHGLAAPLGDPAWGWAIILLTVAVRLVLLPLAIKQTTSMRAMQRLQPEIKKIQSKYKTERSLLKTDPDKYRERRQKQQEAMMALYKQHSVNPAAGCLPLVLQMPVFFALFSVLRGTERVPELAEAGFYIVPDLSATVQAAGAGAWLLVLLMIATTFLTQKQTMAANPGAAQQQQQKVLLYVMPVMLAFFAINLPVGVLLYWVTTNLWTLGQQWMVFRNVEPDAAPAKATKA